MPRLALGSAQFGGVYGVAGPKNGILDLQLIAILQRAHLAGIDMIDTAVSYGNSEQRLGANQLNFANIVTKLPKDCTLYSDIILKSANHLGVREFYAVLWHASQDLLGPEGVSRYQELTRVKEQGLCHRIGVSVYEPKELELLSGFKLDIVQLPCSIFDRRFIESGWLERLYEQGTEIHVRSIFLQGLLLMHPGTRPKYFERWRQVWDKWHDYLAENNLSGLDACVRFAKNLKFVSRVVIGVDSECQLADILKAWGSSKAKDELPFSVDDVELLNPSMWFKS